MVGKGSSCKVYKVINQENKIYAIKYVDLSDLPRHQIHDYINEVKILKLLQNKPGIVKLYDYEIDKTSKSLKMVFFYRVSHSIVNGVR